MLQNTGHMTNDDGGFGGVECLQRRNASIVHVFPRFKSIPDKKYEKFVELCWSELVLYKKFREF